MSKVWPSNATHLGSNNCFYLIKGDRVTLLADDGDELGGSISAACYCGIDEWITAKQPKPWSGPEDGLPPIGMRVMVHECSHDYTKKFNGQTVRIVGHDRGDLAVFAAKDFIYHALVADKFKLAPTAEQIAADKRETAIREIMDAAGIDCLVTATRLADAGFKREGV